MVYFDEFKSIHERKIEGVKQALIMSCGNKTNAAKLLKVSRRWLMTFILANEDLVKFMAKYKEFMSVYIKKDKKQCR